MVVVSAFCKRSHPANAHLGQRARDNQSHAAKLHRGIEHGPPRDLVTFDMQATTSECTIHNPSGCAKKQVLSNNAHAVML